MRAAGSAPQLSRQVQREDRQPSVSGAGGPPASQPRAPARLSRSRTAHSPLVGVGPAWVARSKSRKQSLSCEVERRKEAALAAQGMAGKADTAASGTSLFFFFFMPVLVSLCPLVAALQGSGLAEAEDHF